MDVTFAPSAAGPGRRVIAYPAWKENPYVGILYLATISRGTSWHGCSEFDDLLELLSDVREGDVFHLHWTASICQSRDTEEAGRARLDQFVAAVTAFRAAGGRLLWTVHNRLPHELRHEDLEIELCRFIADTADRVHVMSPSTIELVSDVFPLDPARVVVVDHPSYQGLYADQAGDRQRAREQLGIAADRRAVLFFGQMRPYKGLQHLLDAINLMVERDDQTPVVLLAGRADAATVREISAALPPGVDVVRDHRHVPDEDVPMWFSAADLAVYPYTAILNSGSIHLAATMGVPVVLPGEAHLREQFEGEQWIRFYDPAHPAEGIADILARPESYEAPTAQLREFSERLSPWRISRQMADLIDAL